MSERNTSEFDKLSREIEQLIYVPGKGAGVRGYGLTLTERFPSYSPQEVSALKKRNVRHSMVILAGIVVGVICGLAATALNWGIALISGVFIPLINGATHNWYRLPELCLPECISAISFASRFITASGDSPGISATIAVICL